MRGGNQSGNVYWRYAAIALAIGLLPIDGPAQEEAKEQGLKVDDRIPSPQDGIAAPITQATAVVPLAAQVDDNSEAEVLTAVDERIRFGVSLPDLEKRTDGAIREVMWSHLETGADAITGLGFSIREAGEDLLVTVLPRVILQNGAAEVIDQLRIDVRDTKVTWPAELLLLDEGTGVGILRVDGDLRDHGETVATPLRRPQFRPGKRLSLLGKDQLAPATVVFGFEKSSDVLHCVAGRVARDSRYLGESLPTSLIRLRMHVGYPMAGAPLMDDSGTVVAVMTDRVLDETDEWHAVPLPVLRRVLRDLGTQHGTGVAWIGARFHLESSTPQIVGVREGSPADRAGLRPGDIVVSIGDEVVETLDELADEFYYLSAGEETQIEVLRGLEKLSFSLLPALVDERDLESPIEGLGSGEATAALVRSR